MRFQGDQPAGPQQRADARAAVAELRTCVERAERDRLPETFAQASVDLLRTPQDAASRIAACADFERRPARYFGLLAAVAPSA